MARHCNRLQRYPMGVPWPTLLGQHTGLSLVLCGHRWLQEDLRWRTGEGMKTGLVGPPYAGLLL